VLDERETMCQHSRSDRSSRRGTRRCLSLCGSFQRLCVPVHLAEPCGSARDTLGDRGHVETRLLRGPRTVSLCPLSPVPRSAALMGHRLLWSTPWLQLDDSAALLPTPVRQQRSRSVIVASLTSPKSSFASLPPTTSSHYLAPLQHDPVHPLHPRPRSVPPLSDPASHELTCLPHTLPGPNGSYSPLRLSRRPTDAAAQL
jgi:hypothetical protein